MDIADRVFLVTGGASGLGWGVARRLSLLGASVVIADVDAEGGTAAAERIGGRFARTDVADED
ncbi:SDR family NAD(P)-dependent oxidoreductase, partial [Methylobacterium trifolii]